MLGPISRCPLIVQSAMAMQLSHGTAPKIQSYFAIFSLFLSDYHSRYLARPLPAANVDGGP